MRNRALALMVATWLVACKSEKPSADQPAVRLETRSAPQPNARRAQLTDLTTASTLAPIRAAFNAKKGEARFLTLLSPT